MSALIVHDVSLIGYEQVMGVEPLHSGLLWASVRVGFKIQVYKANPRDAESQSLEQSLHEVFGNFLKFGFW